MNNGQRHLGLNYSTSSFFGHLLVQAINQDIEKQNKVFIPKKDMYGDLGWHIKGLQVDEIK